MKNRGLIACSAAGIHASLGTVYAWSVFKRPFMENFGWSEFSAGIPFGLAIFSLGVFAAIMGRIVEKRGPRFSGLMSTFLWVVSLLGMSLVTSAAVTDNNLRMGLFCLFTVTAGMGLGTGYVTPVSPLMKWFPDRRGLATGVAIMGFGFGAFISAPFMAVMLSGGESISVIGISIPLPWHMPQLGVSGTFLVVALVSAIVMLPSALYIAVPPAGYKRDMVARKTAPARGLLPSTAAQAVRTWPFYCLWLMMFINITCGIAVISVASPMAQDITGAGSGVAAGIVGMIGLFNGGGRFVWSWLSDFTGRPNTWLIFFASQIVAFYLLPSLHGILLFQCVLCFIASCYGGGFATLPAYIADIFGTEYVSSIHGYLLTSWAVAGLVGSSLASVLHSTYGGYGEMMQVFTVIMTAALLVTCLLKLFFVRKTAEVRVCPGA